jgi:hypothetical protein
MSLTQLLRQQNTILEGLHWRTELTAAARAIYLARLDLLQGYLARARGRR